MQQNVGSTSGGAAAAAAATAAAGPEEGPSVVEPSGQGPGRPCAHDY